MSKKLEDMTDKEVAILAGRTFGKRARYYENEMYKRLFKKLMETSDEEETEETRRDDQKTTSSSSEGS